MRKTTSRITLVSLSYMLSYDNSCPCPSQGESDPEGLVFEDTKMNPLAVSLK